MKFLICLFVFTLIPFVSRAAEESGVAPHMTWRIIDFIFFAAIIYYFLKNPVADYFKSRKEEIENSFKEAEKLKAEAENLLKETEEKLEKLNEEIEKIVNTFKSIAQNERENILKEARSTIERIKENIEEEKVSLVNKAKLELLKNLTENAIDSLKKKLSNLTPEKHLKINKKFIGSITE